MLNSLGRPCGECKLRSGATAKKDCGHRTRSSSLDGKSQTPPWLESNQRFLISEAALSKSGVLIPLDDRAIARRAISGRLYTTAKKHSPCRTLISTDVWLSAAVLKTSDLEVGRVVLRVMSLVITPPRVSRPRDRGVTSSSTISLTSPAAQAEVSSQWLTRFARHTLLRPVVAEA